MAVPNPQGQGRPSERLNALVKLARSLQIPQHIAGIAPDHNPVAGDGDRSSPSKFAKGKGHKHRSDES